MSTQDRGVQLHNIPADAGYRLIELPSDLQSLLESDNAPVLRLESSDSSAILKSPDKTWALRQKNTSNALIILRPHAADPASPEQGLAAISTIQETVELDPVREPIANPMAGPNTGSRGRWHERFGKNR